MEYWADITALGRAVRTPGAEAVTGSSCETSTEISCGRSFELLFCFAGTTVRFVFSLNLPKLSGSMVEVALAEQTLSARFLATCNLK